MMNSFKTRKAILIVLPIVAFLALAGGYRLYEGERPAPIPLKKQLYEGVTYRRIVNYAPRLLIAHVLVIDRRIARPRLFVTPPDRLDGPPLLARTTSAFMLEYGVQIAVNGDGFFPWWSRSPADYYPHAGDPVSPNGFAASNGLIYSRGAGEPPEPTLYVSRRGEISFTRIPNRVQQAISGDRMVVLQGKPVQGLDAVTPNPRTAIGISKNGRWIYLVVIDGRQPLYSEGATFTQLADIMIEVGAHYAMNLDGGGSSTMVIAGEDRTPVILNSPIDNYIPGRARPVANHLGIYLSD